MAELARIELDSLAIRTFEPNRAWALTDSSPVMRRLRQAATSCSEV